MAFNVDKKNQLNRILRIIFPVILFLYPLRNICFGVGWTDTGYNYGNFAYMEEMDPMWLFSTYLGNALGNMFTKLPLGNTMMGLNLYTGLFVSVLAVCGYFFFVKEVKLPCIVVFLGEFVGINLCWCPTALLYNYLSYALLGAGVVLLYFALMHRRRSTIFFLLAGLVLGINVFVRFPNLSNMALIVAVWAMGIIRKEQFVTVLKQTGLCIVGYISGLGVCFGFLSLKYGAEEYISGIIRLLSMPSEASDYSVLAMVVQQIRNYCQNLIWIMILLFFMLMGTLVYQILPKSWKWIKNIGYVIAVFCGFYYLYGKNMFNFEYNTYLSMFQWAVMILTATLIAGIVIIFGKGFSEQEKLLAGLNILVTLITPLGSNNHLFLAINNLFFVAPFTFWMVYRLVRWIPDCWSIRKVKVSTYPLRAMLCSVIFMIFLQTTLFGGEFIFLESNGGKNSKKGLEAYTENNSILKGMRMEEERAEILTQISDYVETQGLKGQEVILYGDIPAMAYILEMPFAISAWPDMRSYNYAIMEADLQRIMEEASEGKREFPVVLVERRPGIYMMNGEAGLQEEECTEEEITLLESDKKLELLSTIISREEYQMTFQNYKFMLFEAKREEEND